jgi:DNA mismatch repair protein MSH3
MLAHYAENGSVRVERVNEDLDYTSAFEFLQKFYQEDESLERATASSSTFKSRELKCLRTESGHDPCHLDQPFNDVIGFPKPVVVALAHAVRYLISYGLSDAFKRTTFFTTFLTRSHMLLNANTLENLYVCVSVNHLSLRHCFREIFQNQTDYTRMGSLIWILDRTLTRFGARQLRQWVSRPLVNER